jgi:CelD/BcsL family acetyltransferase involved in cellulose biosynthesis
MRPGPTHCANAVFQQPWWLDALAPGRWDEVTVQREGQTVARMPYVVRGRPRARMLTQPPLTQTLGPWLSPRSSDPADALTEELDLQAALAAALPAASMFAQQFSPAVLTALPFQRAGYRLDLQYTYRLHELDDQDALWDGLRGRIRTHIRRARKQVEIRDDLGLDRFHAVWAKTFERQGLAVPQPLSTLERLDGACGAHDARAMLFAVDESDRVHAVSYVVWDANVAHYLLGGGDPELRGSGAGHLVIWESILQAREHAPVFDFEGSMLQGVERFFRDFGARQTPYVRVTRAAPAARAALALRAGVRRVRALSPD